jgi:hypothetical protein
MEPTRWHWSSEDGWSQFLLADNTSVTLPGGSKKSHSSRSNFWNQEQGIVDDELSVIVSSKTLSLN